MRKKKEHEYYNEEVKKTFIRIMEEHGKLQISSYKRIFDVARPFEELHGKDLAMFNSNDLLAVYNSIAHILKQASILNYNSLVGAYKEWKKLYDGIAIGDICNTLELKSIKHYKKYIILNEDDILNITKYLDIDGGDYNIAFALKLFWDIDGQEDITDVLKLRVRDIDRLNSTVTIYRTVYNIVNRKRVFDRIEPHTYKISDPWVLDALLVYADMDEIYFRGKKGSYRILTAYENDGLIFRMTYTAKTKVGEPLDSVKFSNTLYQFCMRHSTELTEVITINDILASLSLRHMVEYKKTPTQMYNERRYFGNMSSNTYKEIYEENANRKYSLLVC